MITSEAAAAAAALCPFPPVCACLCSRDESKMADCVSAKVSLRAGFDRAAEEDDEEEDDAVAAASSLFSEWVAERMRMACLICRRSSCCWGLNVAPRTAHPASHKWSTE